MSDDFAKVITAATDTIKEVQRLCAEGLLDWKDDPNAPVGARVINGAYPNFMVVVAEIPMEGGRVHYSGMVSSNLIAATVMPTAVCKLCFETGIKAIAAKPA